MLGLKIAHFKRLRHPVNPITLAVKRSHSKWDYSHFCGPLFYCVSTAVYVLLCLSSEHLSPALTQLVWWCVSRWTSGSSVILCRWWRWCRSTTEPCAEFFRTRCDRCECSGIVSEGVNSSGVRGTLRCSGREDGDGGWTFVVIWSVSDSPVGISRGLGAALVGNTLCVSGAELSVTRVSAGGALLSVASVAWGRRM